MKYYIGVKRLPLKRKKKLYYFIEISWVDISSLFCPSSYGPMLLFNLSNTHSWTTYWRADIWRRGWGYNECQFIFQQVNDFLFDKKNNSITFKFFGITTIHYLPEGYIFCVELYLILSDDQTDANLTIGECYLPEEVNTSNEQKQADLE